LATRDRGAVLKAVPLGEHGTLDLEAFERLLTRRTRVVAFAHVSNVLGTINPVAEMCARARRAGALSVVDGAQAAPHLPLEMSALDCDFYVFSAHKMLGPTGIGVLYGRRDILESLEPGRGGSEMIKEVWIDRAQWNDLPWRFEPGTPSIAEAVGLTAAIEYLEKLGMERVAEHGRALTRQALEGLAAIPGVKVYGPPATTDRGAVVAFTVAELHPHDVAALLDAEGIAVRAGHHCAMPLMRRLGVVGTSRASFSVFNSPDEVGHLLAAVAERAHLGGDRAARGRDPRPRRGARLGRRRSLGDAADPASARAPPRAGRARPLRRPPGHVGRVLWLQVLPRDAVPSGHRGEARGPAPHGPGGHPRPPLRRRRLRLPRAARDRGGPYRDGEGAGGRLGGRAVRPP